MPEERQKPQHIKSNPILIWIISVAIPLILFWWQMSDRMDKRMDEKIELKVGKVIAEMVLDIKIIKEDVKEVKDDVKQLGK